MKKKRCNACQATQDADRFSKCLSNKDGLVSKCKGCMSNYHKHRKVTKRKPPIESDVDASWMTGVEEVSLGNVWN